jgi:hypothetical protein
MAAPQIIHVASRDELRANMSSYAAQGYATMHDGGNVVTLSRKKPFNWVLAIICLFIPIIGWIALMMMIIAANRGHQVVELHLAPAA